MARADEAARYRKAAHMTLDQLDWCVEYLRRIHKPKISQQLATNAAALRRRIDESSRDTVTREPGG